MISSHSEPIEQTAPEAGLLGDLCPEPGVDGVGLGEPLAQEHDLHHHREVDLPHGGHLAGPQQLGQHRGLVRLLPGDSMVTSAAFSSVYSHDGQAAGGGGEAGGGVKGGEGPAAGHRAAAGLCNQAP